MEGTFGGGKALGKDIVFVLCRSILAFDFGWEFPSSIYILKLSAGG
jgi:hypothetical protein